VIVAAAQQLLCFCCACFVPQAAEAAAVYDTGLMQDNANGITSANLLTASKDEDLVF
jgi:hypothetical protein